MTGSENGYSPTKPYEWVLGRTGFVHMGLSILFFLQIQYQAGGIISLKTEYLSIRLFQQFFRAPDKRSPLLHR